MADRFWPMADRRTNPILCHLSSAICHPGPSRSDRDEAIRVEPLLQLFLELLALIPDDLAVVCQADFEPLQRPGRRPLEVHSGDVEPAAVAGALELLLPGQPVRRAPQMGADRLD